MESDIRGMVDKVIRDMRSRSDLARAAINATSQHKFEIEVQRDEKSLFHVLMILVFGISLFCGLASYCCYKRRRGTGLSQPTSNAPGYYPIPLPPPRTHQAPHI